MSEEPSVIPSTGAPQPQPLTESVSERLQEKIRYDAILTSIGEGLVVTNKSGRITAFNKAAEGMLLWSADEAIGKPLQDIVKIDYKNGQTQSFASGGQTRLYVVRKDGSTFPAALTVSSYAQEATILGTITLFRDITTEMAVDTMKNEFISLASHQLRTPLSAIKWFSELLVSGENGTLGQQQMEFAKNIHTSTLRMIELVNTLLNISRIESGRIIVEPKPTDIQALIEGILTEVGVSANTKKQSLHLSIPHPLPPISLDPKLIRQVYLNLLTNAIKYSPDQSTITITVTQKDDMIVSEVTDQGYGIPDNEKQKIFDKFYRGTNILEQVPQGTGLGLYFIKSIVDISKGKIWFESTQGKGTTFFFTIPVAGTPAQQGVVTLDS